ncbi:hypothetical protein CKO_04470 [Citrobacter koseri ATCC BAA-895]|uniref:Uncharacterized protein n=1 Tax=Citrobacter koseri (strain ATCC BAA-895 / CDC 4225-83 / SGSC4696) TaxID=290338 RepID=A8APW2_CITK8|nr:hypothetical protein CKO_04470 [Citrobacter koseri ATCC BAA-895]
MSIQRNSATQFLPITYPATTYRAEAAMNYRAVVNVLFCVLYFVALRY